MRILFAIVLLLLSHSPLAELDERIKVVIEEPVQNERHSGISNLRGYAISPEGMGSFYLDVYIDREFAFYMYPYGNRPDVGNAFPDYPGSDVGGFSMAFNYKDLVPGEHEIRVRAYDNADNYNDATTTFTTERFVGPFIADDAEVDFSSTNSITIPDGRTIDFRNVTIEGRLWDFKLVWDKASQGLKIVDVSYLQHVNNDGAGSDSTGQPPPEDLTIFEACSSYATSVSSSRVTFENGAELLSVPEGLQWDSEAYAFFIKYSDGRWIAVQYSSDASGASGPFGWNAFWHAAEGYPPQPCEWRREKAARPFISNLVVGVLDDIYNEYEIGVQILYEFSEGVNWAGSIMYLEHSCQNWELGDYLLIPFGQEKNAHAFLNLTKAREADGDYAFCRE